MIGLYLKNNALSLLKIKKTQPQKVQKIVKDCKNLERISKERRSGIQPSPF